MRIVVMSSILFLFMTTGVLAENDSLVTGQETIKDISQAEVTAVQDPPVGMEYLQVSAGYRVLVPKGTKILKIGNASVPEGIRAFVSRRFQELDQRLNKIEATQEELKKENEELRKKINEQQSP